MDKIKTGILIREARKKKNYTQSELGDLLGVTNKAVSRWEKGEAFPDVGVLEELARLLDLKIQDLVTGEVQSEETDREAVMAELVRLSKIQLREKKKKILEYVLWTGLLLLDFIVCILTTEGDDGFTSGWGIIACLLLTLAGIIRQAVQTGTEPLGKLWFDRLAIIFPIVSLIVIYLAFAVSMIAVHNGAHPFGLQDVQIGPFLMTWLCIGFYGNLLLLIASVVLWLKGTMGVHYGHILSVATLFTSAMLGNSLHQMTSWDLMIQVVIWDTLIPLLLSIVTIILYRFLIRREKMTS